MKRDSSFQVEELRNHLSWAICKPALLPYTMAKLGTQVLTMWGEGCVQDIWAGHLAGYLWKGDVYVLFYMSLYRALQYNYLLTNLWLFVNSSNTSLVKRQTACQMWWLKLDQPEARPFHTLVDLCISIYIVKYCHKRVNRMCETLWTLLWITIGCCKTCERSWGSWQLM